MLERSFLLSVLLLTPFARAGVADLRCEYLPDPLGIDVPQPRLSWKLQPGRHGLRQTCYRLLVARLKHLGVPAPWEHHSVAAYLAH